MSVDALRSIWILSQLLWAVLLGRLILTGLYRLYPAFFTYLSIALARSVLLAVFFADPRTSQFRLAWMLSEPIVIGLQLAMSFEIYRRVSAQYPNLGRFASRVLLCVAVASTLICAATLVPDISAANWRFPVAQFLLLLKRTEATLLFLGLLLTLGFYRWWYTPKSSNVTRHTVIACAHFGILSVYCFAVDVFHFAYWPATMVYLGALLACSVTWTFSLSRRGEIVMPSPKMSPERYEAARAGWAMLLEFANAVNRQKLH